MATAVGTRVAVGYFRVSSPHQVGERHSSLETQQDRFHQHCERMGYVLGATFTDVMSGRRDDRREYQRMLAHAGQGHANVVVVQWLDRFGRHPKEILSSVWALQEQGIVVEATDEDLKEEMILLIKAGMAGAESRRIAERVRANMGRAIGKGVHVGNAPYGLRPVKTLVEGKVVTTWEIDPVEAPVVREMYRMAVVENRGFHPIADALNTAGHRTKSGGPWAAWGVRLILTNEALAGALVWGRKSSSPSGQKPELVRVPGFFPAILNADEWAQLQQRLSLRRELTPRGKGAVSSYLLSGLARCGECGAAMVGKTGNRGRYHYYACSNGIKGRGRCPGYVAHSAKRVEPAVLEYLGQFSDPQRVRELLAAQATTETPALEAQLTDVEKRLVALEKDFLANLDLLKRRILNEAEFARANETRRAEREALQARREDLKARIEAERHRTTQAGAIPSQVAGFLETFQQAEPRLAKAQLQTILKAVHVYQDGRVELEFRE